jgi:3D (Asp-Asp-Asp) domain-containing protein
MKLIHNITFALILLSSTPALARTFEANVSGYCLCEKCCGRWTKVYPRRTASGHVIKPGDKFVAAPRNIPFGTLIVIPGYNNGRPVPVLDRGGAIKGNKLDLFFPTHKAALEWGRRKIIVKIAE